MIALAIGTILAVAALYYVLDPLFRPRIQGLSNAGTDFVEGRDARADEGGLAIEALREIEFDRATGKLSESDYAALKEKYTSAAVAAMRASDNLVAAHGGGSGTEISDVEAMVARFRGRLHSCPDCGPRVEPDAVYCSNCGRYLGGACRSCGAMPDQPGARFCSSCGASLAA